ncbi:hypothetical protein C8N25_101506 [Algoriphagus antarcticus]|uniref:Uncharacterized protein n=1 Tax=Algoriphagus antarcticus TaxID=238540 RepID=A0A3E0EAL5_9BACT|nr:hypothetical protein C8N25_101506 [Algoriphagus antarcticus]
MYLIIHNDPIIDNLYDIHAGRPGTHHVIRQAEVAHILK